MNRAYRLLINCLAKEVKNKFQIFMSSNPFSFTKIVIHHVMCNRCHLVQCDREMEGEKETFRGGQRLLGWEVLPFDSLGVKHLISPDKITPKSHIKVSRIKEMIT